MTRPPLILSLATTIALATLSHILFGKSDVERLDDLVKRSVPLGSPKQLVYDFLDANAIRSSPYNAGPDPLVKLPDALREWRRYVDARLLKHRMAPWSPDYTIHLVFYFDESYRVTDYKVEKFDRPADSF